MIRGTQLIPLSTLLASFFLFPLLSARLWKNGRAKGTAIWLALLSLILLPYLAIHAYSPTLTDIDPRFLTTVAATFALYIVWIIASWRILCALGRDSTPRFWLAFFFPIGLLAIQRITGVVRQGRAEWLVLLVGISYLAFRLSRLAIEYRTGVVEKPTLSEYLAFALFPPTLTSGPITKFSQFQPSIASVSSAPDRWQCGLRILMGLTKYLFLARLADQLSYRGLLLDGHPHPLWPDLPVAMLCYYLYLFWNFSGWCDMAIGASGLMGIEVAENFDRPFQARNMQDYWTRWHITLSLYMRDIVFSPLSLTLTRAWGAKYASAATGASIFVVFLLIGFWHGSAPNFVVAALFQGLGVVIVHYYGLHLRKKLGRDGYARYMKNAWIRRAAIAMTFVYSCTSQFFFANSFDKMGEIFAAFR